MYIDTSWNDSGDLVLSAYSFNASERASLKRELVASGAAFRVMTVDSDSSGRPGVGYVVRKDAVASLADYLSVIFNIDGSVEIIDIEGGSNWHCSEITTRGPGEKCQNINADSESAANVKCALVARSNLWFGSIADEGSCP